MSPEGSGECLCFENNYCLNFTKYSSIFAKTMQDFSYECVTEKYVSYFSTKTYVVGAQKNHLIEMVLLSTQSIC